MYNPRPPYSNELYHYGVKGMKWGKHKKDSYASAHSDYLRRNAPTSNADAMARGRKIASIMSNTAYGDRAVVSKYADPAKMRTTSNPVSWTPIPKPKDYRGSENDQWYKMENKGYAHAARQHEAYDDRKNSYVRNHRSDFENAVSDFREDMSKNAEKIGKRVRQKTAKARGLVKKGKRKVLKLLKEWF